MALGQPIPHRSGKGLDVPVGPAPIGRRDRDARYPDVDRVSAGVQGLGSHDQLRGFLDDPAAPGVPDHDRDVVRQVGGRRNAILEVCELRDATNLVQLPGTLQLVHERDQVDRIPALHHPEQCPVQDLVRVNVEAARAPDRQRADRHRGRGIWRNQDAPQDPILGLLTVGRQLGRDGPGGTLDRHDVRHLP